MKRLLIPLLALALRVLAQDPASPDTRRIVVWADAGASEATLAARDALLGTVGGAPFFSALAKTHRTGHVIAAAALEAAPADRAAWRRQALDNVVIVGTPDEGAAAARAMGFTYGIDTARREIFRFGFGRFSGDAGCVETCFNPWLYSDRFDDNPYSTIMVRISGTTPAGVALAADAFSRGLINGIVLGPGAQPVDPGILCRTPSMDPPPDLPAQFDGDGERILVKAGWSQVPEQDYRAMLEYGSVHEPSGMWRVKYLATGALDDCSGAAWVRGPAPMAWGNAVTVARFDDPSDAARAWAGIRAACRERKEFSVGTTPAFSVAMPTDGLSATSLGEVAYWAQDEWLVMSSLPEETHAAVAAAVAGDLSADLGAIRADAIDSGL